nr:LOW QUALITY PROTEIN: tectonin beta-propeller repeat-containing protein 2-like [Rhipicephalus microplus]
MELECPDDAQTDAASAGGDGAQKNGLAKMPASEEQTIEVFLKEFAPLTHLLSQLPQNAQRGLTRVGVKLTCLDVVAEYIAIGSNVGVVFLYDRTKNTVTRLRCTEMLDAITSISLISSVDFMLVVGCQSGLCVAYQIPMAGRQSKMEKYLIRDIHHAPITSVCWSPNAMKFYSGDAVGCVTCTEIDYNQHLCKSNKVHVENHPVIQLDYVPQTLLISTTKRTVICHCGKDGVRIVQLGSHERKSNSNFGACFAPPQSYGERQVTVWACRPGMRLWKGTPNGVVLETLLLRDSLKQEYFQPQMLGLPKESYLEKLPDSQFGLLKPYRKRLLLTWSSETFFVVDPAVRSLAVVCPGFVNITDVAVCGEEIFVLQAKRHIVRLAAHPEDIWDHPEEDNEMRLPDMTAIKNTIVTPLAEITALLRDTRLPDPQVLQLFKNTNGSAVLDWFRQKAPRLHESDSGGSSPSGTVRRGSTASGNSRVAETALDAEQVSSTEMVATQPGDALSSVHRSRSFESMQFPNESEDEEDIVFTARKRKPKHGSSTNAARSIPTLVVPASSDERPSPVPTYDEVFASPSGTSPLDQSTLNKENKKSECPPPYSASENELVSHILSRYGQLKQRQRSGEASASQPLDIPVSSSLAPNDSDNLTPSPASASSGAAETSPEDGAGAENGSGAGNPEPKDCPDLEPELSIEDIYSKKKDATDSYESAESSVPDVVFHGIVEPRFPRYDFHWAQVKGPGPVVSLAACDGYLCCVDSRDNVYYSRLMGREFTWRSGSRPMNRVALSPSGGVLWAIYKEKLYAARSPLSSEPLAMGWDEVAMNVVSVSVTETTAWYVTGSGYVFMCPDVTVQGKPVTFYGVGCFVKVQQVACYDDVVWALTTLDTLLGRVGISEKMPQGTGWTEIPLPSKGSPACIHLGYNGTGWLIDSEGSVFFKTNLKNSSPGGYNKEWWQVDLNEFVYQMSPALAKMQKNLSSVFSTDKISHKVLGKGKWHLVAGKHGVWFCESMSSHLNSCRRDITGYFWEKAHVNLLHSGTKWTDIAASGVFKDEGVVWGLQTGGQLAALIPRLRKWYTVGLPRGTSLSCIAPSPESLWALTSDGRVMVRTGVNPPQPMGDTWVSLDTSQLGDAQLTHISCSYETVWACDNKGTVYMRIGSLRPPAPRTLPPAWVPIESGYQEESPFISASASENPFSLPFEISRFLKPHLTKVYVGPRNFMVWALDSRKHVYVREGIYPELHIGTSWVEVPGVQARQLCVSEKAVWALTPSGEIFRRFNISNSNFVGDYWKRIPGHAACLAVSVDDRLWAVAADGSALQLSTFELPSRISEMDTLGLAASAEKTDADMDGWELV